MFRVKKRHAWLIRYVIKQASTIFNIFYKRALQNLMREEKKCKICLIKAGSVVNSGAMDKFSNEKQANFRLFNLCNRFCKALYKIKGTSVGIDIFLN